MKHLRILKNRSKNRAFMSLMVMVLMGGFVMIGAAMLSLSQQMHRDTSRSQEKLQSIALAESGASLLYDTIRNQMQTYQTYPFEVTDQAFNYSVAGVSSSVGTCSAQLLNARKVETDIDHGSYKTRLQTYYFTIEGKGTTTSGLISKVRVGFVGTIEYNLVNKYTLTNNLNPNLAQMTFPAGAICANGSVNINSTNGLKSTSPDGASGHIIANQGISFDTPGHNKNSVSAANFLDIQGQYVTVSGGPYDRTVSPSGLGNSNGSSNYSSPGTPSGPGWPGSAANTVLQMTSAAAFVSSADSTVWQQNWSDNARQGTSMAGPVNSGSVPIDPVKGFRVLRTPAYIDGNLTIDAINELKLLPSSTDPKKNIIYVHGNVTNFGTLTNLGVTIVVEGKYSDGATSKYQVSEVDSPFVTHQLTMMRSNLVSLSSDADALNFTTNQAAQVGLVYAMNGGITIGGDAEFTGALMAGGATNGNVTINSLNQFVMHYEPYAATGGDLPVDAASVIDTSLVIGTVARNYQGSAPYLFQHVR